VNPFVTRLREIVGDRVTTDPEQLAAHRRDAWVLSELEDLEERPGPLPCAVVEPRDTGDVARTLALAREMRVPVVPFGGGSGVCGAIRVPEGALVLSTRKLTGLIRLEPQDLTATFRAGTNGLEAEQVLDDQGLTLGHWPQSIELSSVGGWCATRASGQFSTAYGSIEDLVLALEVVLPNGSVLRTRETPRASAGPDLRQLFLGSEGTLGVITEVTFSLRPRPESRRGQAFHFADLRSGLDPVRRLLAAGWRPPVVRLYDAAESGRSFADFCPQGRALLLLLHEGPESLVQVQESAAREICERGGGSAASPASVEHWLEHRNRVPGFRGFLEKGIILDTIEVAATWSRIAELYDRVLTALQPVEGLLLASAHSSHSYRSGTNLYFTFVARPDDRARMPEVYRECWQRTLTATLECGGGIAHHHGIGRVRRDALPGELGATGVELLRSVKNALDPAGLLNPGALLPEPPGDS
jgi:alkyldihydroxyacetonephosphate synthase